MKKSNAVSYIVLLAILVLAGWLYFKQNNKITTVSLATPKTDTAKNLSEITISTKNIKEENFSGKVAVVAGKSLLAQKAEEYINQTVADFRKQANTDVPDMRAKFGADSPTAQYEIDIDAKYINGKKAESVVMLVYNYTGGAHGNSVYKVITTSLSNGKILSLSDVITKGEEKAFTAFVKKELNAWRPEGADASPVFPEDVAALKFDSFVNWSLDEKNLILYFDQYAIGPGALGPVAFPIQLVKIRNFLDLIYK